MINTLIGQKTDQTQSFLENGNRIPVTEISVAENVVLQVKTPEIDKYSAVQLGIGAKKKSNKAILGQAKKAGITNAPIKIKEVRNAPDELKTGDAIKVDGVFKPGDIVQVTGTSKGKGFAGVVKRHGFSGGPKTHGQSDRHRAPGSIGQGTTPGRVYKGKRMAGRMGQDTVTVRNLTVVGVDPENNKLYVSGLIPGSRNSFVYITRTGENKKYVPLISDKKEVVEEVAAPVAKDQEAEAGVSEEAQVEPSAKEVEVTSAVEDVKDITETVTTASETVETAADTVQTPAETESGEPVSNEAEAKVAGAENSGEPKEENG